MKNKVRKICLLVIIIALTMVYFNSYKEEKGLRVEEFNNFYSGESIEVFYEKIKGNREQNKKLFELEKTYNVKEIAKKESKEIEKILKTTSILKVIVQKDDVIETDYYSAYDILKNKKKDSKKLSDRDMAIIQRDLILALGYESRIGVFRKENAQFKKNGEYYVVEYWSPEANKWILLDYDNEGFIKKNGEKLGAIELLESKVSDIQFNGKTSSKDYKRKIKDFLVTYTIPIDNTIDREISNSYITYIKEGGEVELVSKGEFVPPAVYTREKVLFEKSPWSGRKKEDKKGYIVIMKKALDEEDKVLKGEKLEREKNKIILACHKNGAIQKEYKYRVNNGEYIEVKDMYEEIYLPIGYTEISVLEKSSKEEASIIINRQK